jgi:hypothetical protein
MTRALQIWWFIGLLLLLDDSCENGVLCDPLSGVYFIYASLYSFCHLFELNGNLQSVYQIQSTPRWGRVCTS